MNSTPPPSVVALARLAQIREALEAGWFPLADALARGLADDDPAQLERAAALARGASLHLRRAARALEAVGDLAAQRAQVVRQLDLFGPWTHPTEDDSP